MTFETLLYEVDADGIALVTINRPDKLNALNETVIDELDRCFAAVEADDAVRGVVLTGAGPKSFVAGADISRFPALDAVSGRRFALRGQAVFNRIEALPKPVVAAVNGFALGGGCELAMACHLRVAAEHARFGQPEVNLGLIPGYGGTQRLPRLVGRGRATELILTGEAIDARRAHEIGLVNRIVPAAELLETAKELVRTIAAKAPVAVALALEAVRASDLDLPQGLALEATLFGQACATEDFREGVAAFLERRQATFKGR
ncbi:enoyl-CoA hydratase/isomerase family protein [Rhodocaloribacter litoris]|uniref:enoyl-CoA hydratase/isomerase family protein n=1 Tax=Rhodocaloribacter litoris TaxID=2558931 RepID=UPI0014207177|nr:enoyl-CoA hydratase-related protein [Rhodocaloribacter litoris]QXD16957.1 enoyl-CoA hydratase/isomerase family protein [Rhodocaloribacter litoris]